MTMQVIGAEDIKRTLEQIAPKHSRNLMRATVQGIASEISKESKKRAPKDTGDLKKAIFAKRKKSPPDKPVSEVIVRHGSQAKYDAFYWRFVEYGTVKQSAQPFIKPSEELVGANLNAILTAQFGKKLEALLKRERKKQAKA